MQYHITAGRVGTEFDIDRLHSIRARFRRGAARPVLSHILPADDLSADTKDARLRVLRVLP
jgi:hypothetical protein